MDKGAQVRQRLSKGQTYREIMKDMGFKSTASISHHAKGDHRHVLKKTRGKYECVKCDSKFVML